MIVTPTLRVNESGNPQVRFGSREGVLQVNAWGLLTNLVHVYQPGTDVVNDSIEGYPIPPALPKV